MFALIYLCPQQNILPPQTYLGAQNGGNATFFAPTPSLVSPPPLSDFLSTPSYTHNVQILVKVVD